MRWIKKTPVAPHLLGVSPLKTDDLMPVNRDSLVKFKTQESSIPSDNSKYQTISESGNISGFGKI